MLLNALGVVTHVEQPADVIQDLLRLDAAIRRHAQLRRRRVVADSNRACADLPHEAVVLYTLELRDEPVREIIEQMPPGKRRADRDVADQHDDEPYLAAAGWPAWLVTPPISTMRIASCTDRSVSVSSVAGRYIV